MIAFHLGTAQIRAQIKQIVLDQGKPLPHITICMQPGNAHRGVQLINRTIGIHAHRMFGDTRAIAQRGFTIISGFGVNFV